MSISRVVVYTVACFKTLSAHRSLRLDELSQFRPLNVWAAGVGFMLWQRGTETRKASRASGDVGT